MILAYDNTVFEAKRQTSEVTKKETAHSRTQDSWGG
jgi:hypothetical protein